ncbi:MAG: hypothetical protein OIF55_18610, partial [Amphritea sp.]|nr:hypothetical protein [Amphritea sp.]
FVGGQPAQRLQGKSFGGISGKNSHQITRAKSQSHMHQHGARHLKELLTLFMFSEQEQAGPRHRYIQRRLTPIKATIRGSMQCPGNC